MNTKEDLKQMAKILCLPVPTKLRKDEYATNVADAVLPMGVRQLILGRQRNVISIHRLEQLRPEVLLGELEYGV